MIDQEESRQESVRRYGLADLDPLEMPDAELTALAVRARRLMGTEHAGVNILDGDGALMLAGSTRVALQRQPRTDTVCDRVAAAFPEQRSLLSYDLPSVPLVADVPYVTGELGTALSFYAGVPLIGIEGQPIGVICAWSHHSGPSPAPDIEALETVGRAVVAVLDARRRIFEVSDASSASQPLPLPDAGPTFSIHTVIDDQMVRTLFQPIVELKARTVVGYEALSRGPEGSTLESPMALLDAARRVGRLEELDWLCRVLAMKAASAADLPAGLSWFINVEPAGVTEPCPEHLRPALAQAGENLRVVLEIVERDLNGHVTHLVHAADEVRRGFWGVALDDVGSQESSLALLPLIKPDIVKLDMSLVQDGPTARATDVVAAVRAYAERTGAMILAEGIETEEHEQLARVYGATYGQGYLYGSPGELPTDLPTPRMVIPLRQHAEPVDGLDPFEVATQSRTPQQGTKDLLLHLCQQLERRCEQLSDPFVLLATIQDARFFSDRLRERYLELSVRSALTVVQVPGVKPEQSPTFQLTTPLPGIQVGDAWVVIVLSAGFSAAFAARDVGDQAPDRQRRFDFVLTHDEGLVTAMARSLLQQLVPAEELPVLAYVPNPRTSAGEPIPEAPRGFLKRVRNRH